MDESLLPDDNYSNNTSTNRSGDVLSASQASLQRSASLLDRIRAHRERESIDASSSSSFAEIPRTFLPTTDIPNYQPIASDDYGNGGGQSMMGASSLNFSSLIRGFGNRTHNHTAEASRGLLDASSPEEYSMENYFRTFVNDVYSYFRSLPAAVQAGVILLMLFIIYKCI